ncbi:MAG: cohesin domain-containing protein [Patescibacteria group bacterium]
MIKHLLLSLACVLGLSLATQAKAATLYVLPDRYAVPVGDTFTATVFTDTEDVGTNAIQAEVLFPNTLVEVVSLNSGASVLNYWLDGPSFSNEAGSVSFIGGSATGLSGKSLRLLSIAFKVKAAGSIPLTLTNAAITASDGNGTNVLTSMRGATIDAGGLAPSTSSTQPAVPSTPPPLVQIVRKPTIAAQSPAKPKLTIPLFPDDQKWYNTRGQFLVSWPLPTDISAVASALDKNPKTIPQKSEGLFDNKFFDIREDGIWYLHMRFKNNIGWGETTHVRLAIDTVAPSILQVRALDGFTAETRKPTLALGGEDRLSGIDSYTITIDTDAPYTVKEATTTLPLLNLGVHTVRIEARDLAGNTAENTITLQVLPIASPTLTSWTQNVYIGEGKLEAAGTAEQGVTVWLALRATSGELITSQSVEPDTQGNWKTVFDLPLKKGTYKIEVVAQNDREAISETVFSENISVDQRPLLTIAGIGITSSVFLFAVLLALIIAFGAGRYLQLKGEQRMGWRTLIAKRDIYSFLTELEQQLKEALAKAEGGKTLNMSSTATIQYQLKQVLARVQKMKYYLPEGVENIPEKKRANRK